MALYLVNHVSLWYCRRISIVMLRVATRYVRPIPIKWTTRVTQRGKRVRTNITFLRGRRTGTGVKPVHSGKKRHDISRINKLKVLQALRRYREDGGTPEQFYTLHEHSRNGALEEVHKQTPKTIKKWAYEAFDDQKMRELEQWVHNYGHIYKGRMRIMNHSNVELYGIAPMMEKCLCLIRNRRAKLALSHGPSDLINEAVRWLHSSFHFIVMRPLLSLSEQRAWASMSCTRGWMSKLAVCYAR